jgi:hypothetical protein
MQGRHQQRLLGAGAARREGDDVGDRLHAHHQQDVAGRAADAERLEEEPEGGEAEQPADALPGRDLAQVAGRRAEDDDPLFDPVPEAAHAVRPEVDRDRDRQQQRPGDDREDLRVFGPEGELEGGQVRQLRRRRQQPLRDRVEEDEHADAGVEDRLDEEGGGDRGVGRAGDLAFGEEDLGDVAGVGGEDRIDPGAGEVGGGDAQEGDADARVGGAQDVAPGPGAGQLHPRQAAERQRKGGPVDVGQVLEEARSGVAEGFGARCEVGEVHRS